VYAFAAETDGYFAEGGLTMDWEGNLYGTTSLGGASPTCGFFGCGTVFKIDPRGKETVLYSFTGSPDGEDPYLGSLIRDPWGNLYGTTDEGGSFGNGAVFKVDLAGKETVLYSFTGLADGGSPVGGLTMDAHGNLYGTASAGGYYSSIYGENSCCGTVYKLDPAGHLTVLHAFDITEGSYPESTPILDGRGNLYATTTGSVFKLDLTTLTLTTLYGGWVTSSVIMDEAGNFYGTSSGGGEFNAPTCQPYGCGTVFKVDPAGKQTVLYNFTGGADGGWPIAGVIRDAAGNLYGTTYSGGTQANNCDGYCGVVFKLDPAGNETVLYAFTEAADGGNPTAPLMQDAAGDLYGTTTFGGTLTGTCGGLGCGTVFKLTPLRKLPW
jgi:uncharacterized repeat protein (TIGR03803 family)